MIALSHGVVDTTFYSARLMLHKFSLVELLAMDLHQLQDNLPWIPMKVLKVSRVLYSTSLINSELYYYDAIALSPDPFPGFSVFQRATLKSLG